MNGSIIPGKIFTVEKLEEYGNRLHFNTMLNIPINGLAIFLILNYSINAMGFYKYYNLMTILGVFFMDFHSSFIFGIYSMFPAPAICAAGLSRNWGWFWGEIINYNLVHISVSVSGFSIFYGVLYQYVSLFGRIEIFHKPIIFVAMIIFMIIYPIPLIVMHSINVDVEASKAFIKEHYSNMYQLYINGPCNMNMINTKFFIYVSLLLTQIFLVYFVAIILVYKIRNRLVEFKTSMSERSLIARKQYLYALILQMLMPLIFLVIPISIIFIFVVTGIGIRDVDEIANWILQMIGIHSCGNAVTVIVMIKPYRQAIIQWIQKLRSIICKSDTPVTVLIDGATTSVVVTVANK